MADETGWDDDMRLIKKDKHTEDNDASSQWGKLHGRGDDTPTLLIGYIFQDEQEVIHIRDVIDRIIRYVLCMVCHLLNRC